MSRTGPRFPCPTPFPRLGCTGTSTSTQTVRPEMLCIKFGTLRRGAILGTARSWLMKIPSSPASHSQPSQCSMECTRLASTARSSASPWWFSRARLARHTGTLGTCRFMQCLTRDDGFHRPRLRIANRRRIGKAQARRPAMLQGRKTPPTTSARRRRQTASHAHPRRTHADAAR